MDRTHEVERRGELLRRLVQLVLAQRRHAADLALHLAHVSDGLHHIARAGLALRSDHRRALADAPQSLAEVARAADERHGEFRLIDVPHVVGRRKHFRLVDVVDLDGLQNPRLGDVPDAALRHHRDRDGGLDALDHRGVAHAGDATRRADVGGNPLQRHHRACAGRLGDLRLLGRRDVHDHAALEHLREIAVQFLSVTHYLVPFLS